MNYRPGYFKGKKVTVMGVGLLGRGVGDIMFLANDGAEIIATDLKDATELAPSVEALKGFKNITFVLGGHRIEDFQDRDFILKAAGVPLESPFIAEARKNKIPIEMSSALFARLSPVTVVGVTGTRGKSTTAHLIYEILKAGLGSKQHIFLGGNIKGVSTLAFLNDAKQGDIAVLELDSWQLQGFGDEKISPHIAVFTTFLPDHLNYYHGDLNAYLADKANIFRFQTSEDMLVLGAQVAPLVKEKYGTEIVSTTIVAGAHDLPLDWKVNIPGLHNRYNAALAMRTAEIFNIGTNVIKDAIENFKGVTGRLEFIRDFDGIKIYNDTTATTPDATLAGIRAFGPHHNVVLIFGGSDKDLDMKHLFLDLPNYTKAIITLPGTGTTRIEKELKAMENVKIVHAESMQDAVAKAIAHSHKGDNLLLSPGFASYGMFKNEFDRGEQFVKIVNELN